MAKGKRPEPVEIASEDSIVPVYFQPLTDEELAAFKDDEIKQQDIANVRQKTLSNGLGKLMKLGLTEDEARAVIGL